MRHEEEAAAAGRAQWSTEAKESLIRETELCIDLLRSQLLLGFKSNEYECDSSPIFRLINSRSEMVHCSFQFHRLNQRRSLIYKSPGG